MNGIINDLIKQGFEAFIVGGAVRDHILGVPPHDEDIVTNALPEQIINLFRQRKIEEVGKSYGVVIVDGTEVATYRKDRYAGFNDKAVEISYASTLKEDVLRRDFTINALALDPLTGQVIDHVGGLEDLQLKIIRFVGDPVERIKEDPNRILRACRFAAKIGGTVEPETLKALKASAGYVKKYVTAERIAMEIRKAMEIQRASIFFRLLQELGILGDILPSLSGCDLHDGGKHHNEDVFEHQMLSGDHVSTRYKEIKPAAYLHDVGKPASYDPEARTFYDHEKIGAALLENELRDLKFSNTEITRACGLVRNHMAIHFTHPSPKSVRRILRKLHEAGVSFRDILRLYDADQMGRVGHSSAYRESRFLILLEACKGFRAEMQRKDPVHALGYLKLNGRDVMRIAGIKPSRRVGEILDALLEAVIENPEINNENDLTQLVREQTM